MVWIPAESTTLPAFAEQLQDDTTPSACVEQLAQFNTLYQCQLWVRELPAHNQKQAPLLRLTEALRVVDAVPSRKSRDNIQFLLKQWSVPQFENGSKRIFPDVCADLKKRILAEANRLKNLDPKWAYAAIRKSANESKSSAAKPASSNETHKKQKRVPGYQVSEPEPFES